MDPISIIGTCYSLANTIYTFVEKIEENESEKIRILRKAACLREPLRILNSQKSDIISSKREGLLLTMKTLQEIDKFRIEYNENSYIKKAFRTAFGKFSRDIQLLNTRLNDALIILQVGIAVDNDQADIIRQLNQKQEILIDQIESLKASATKANSFNLTLETLYVNDPEMTDFDDERSVLGRGGFGVTYRKKNRLDNSLYAIKVIRKRDADANALSVDQITHEAEFLQDLNHPNIVRYFASFKSKNDTLFNIVMELVEGGSLLQQITSSTPPARPLIKKWLVQTLRALQYMHDDMRVLHRDIKPHNLLLTQNSFNIKIIDLGLATIASSNLNSTVVGTPMYASHEKASSLRYDGRDDIWGVGCVWSELLTRIPLNKRGAFNFEEKPEFSARRKELIRECMVIDNEIGSIIEKMLEPHQDLRYTAKDCLDMLSERGDVSPRPYRTDSSTTTTTSPMSPMSPHVPVAVEVVNSQPVVMGEPMMMMMMLERKDSIYSDMTCGSPILSPYLKKSISDEKMQPVDMVYEQFIRYCQDGDCTSLIQFFSEHDCTHYLNKIDIKDTNKRTPLIYACTNGHLDIVQFLLDKGVNVNMKDHEGWTALTVASYDGYTDIIELLIDKGNADVNIQDNNGDTALHLTCQNGYLEVVELLLEKGADFSIKNHDGSTALLTSSVMGHVDLVKLFLKKGDNVNIKDNNFVTSLHFACQEGHYEVVNVLLEGGANVNCIDKYRSVALHYTCQKGYTDIVQLILNYNADLNMKDNNGETPLILASYNGHIKIVQLLLDKGADIHKKDNDGETALIRSSYNNNSKIITLLLDRGADIHMTDNDGWTALTRASYSGLLDIVELLVDRGADIHTRDKDGKTALIRASYKGHLSIVQYLLNHGADLNTTDKEGYSSFILACQNGCVEVAQYLLEKGVDINSSTNFGTTALIGASFKGSAEIVKFLIIEKANLNIKDQNNLTALHYASEEGRYDVVKMLLDGGADVSIRDNYHSVPIHYATHKGYYDIVKLLIERGTALNVQDNNGDTVLIIACYYGHMKIVKLLLDKGAEFDMKNTNGYTALIQASDKGHLSVVKVLIDRGVDIHLKDNNRWTALYHASVKGHIDIVKLLLEKGANVNLKHKAGMTALNLAKSEEIRHLLHSQGATF